MMMTTSLLLVSAGLGFVWLVLLFLFCFCGVHGIRIAKYGWTPRKQPPAKPAQPTPPIEKEKAPAPPQEPIYYIVEKKRTRQKNKYGEPKEFRFK